MTSAVSWDSREITNVSASSSVAMRAVTSTGATLDALAPVAQGIERAPPERKVAGSIPARRIFRWVTRDAERLAGTIHEPSLGASRTVSRRAGRCPSRSRPQLLLSGSIVRVAYALPL